MGNLTKGMPISEMVATLEIMEQYGITRDMLRHFRSDQKLAYQTCGIIKDSYPGGYTVIVDYSKTLAEMINAGKYMFVDRNITEINFPVPSCGPAHIFVELVHFGRAMSSDEVRQEFKARGLRVATLPELLAFGASYPGKQRESPILALGSECKDGVPCLYGDSGCELNLHWGVDSRWGGPSWNGRHQFAGVRLPVDR